MSERKVPRSVEQRIVIKFLVGENVPSAEIHHRLQQQYGEECLLRTGSNPSRREGGGCGFTLSRSHSCCAVRLVYTQISPGHIWTTLYMYNHNGVGWWCRTWRPRIPVLHVLCTDPVDAVHMQVNKFLPSLSSRNRPFRFHGASARSHNTFPTHRSLPHFSYGLPTPSLTAYIISYRPSAFFFLTSCKTFYYFLAFITTVLHECLLLLSETPNYTDLVYRLKWATETCYSIELKTYI